jgi:hypothetical protein
MKKAPPVRLSLRKLLLATLAVGPLAILPSPVWATLPTFVNGAASGNSFTVSNGSVGNTTGTGVITAADRSILVWGLGNFNIAAGETYNFQVPGGSVLNKVGYTTAGVDTAVINGSLISSGKVFVLANGNITVGPGAQINTSNGLVLSTLQDPGVDNTFLNTGNLSFNGTSAGNITIGNSTAIAAEARITSGNLSVYSGNIAIGNLNVVVGDLILNQGASANATALNIAATGGPTTVAGNLTVITNNGAVTESQPVKVTGNTSISSGTGNISLNTAANDFSTITVNTSANAALQDANGIVLGASTVGSASSSGNLTVNAGGNITTSGAVAVSKNVTLTTTGSAGNGEIVFSNGSSAGGTFNATTSAGNVTANVVGNLTTGNIFTGGAVALSLSLTNGGTGYTAAPSVTFTGGGGSGAIATATVNTTTGQVTGLTVTNSGAGYTSAPTIVFTGGGVVPTTAATATALLVAPIATNNATITNGGGGYATAPTVGFSTQTGATAPTATATITNGVVTGIVINTVGSGYTSAPSVTLSAPDTGTNRATAAVVLQPSAMTSVTVTNGGTGYVAIPTVTFSTVGTGTGLTATANLTGASVTTGNILTTAGTNYTAAPTVTFVGGGSNPVTAAVATNTLAVTGAGNVSLTTNATANITGTIAPANNVTVTAAAISATSNGNIGNSTATANVVTLTATAGNIILPSITANTLTVSDTGGNITQAGGISLGSATVNGTATFNAGSTGNITLNNSNNASPNLFVTLVGNTANLTNQGNIVVANATLAGGFGIDTTGSTFGNGTVTLGLGAGSAAPVITVNGPLTITTNGSDVSDDPAAKETVLGAVTVNTMGAGYGQIANNVTITAGTGFLSAPSVTITGNSGGVAAAATASINTTTTSLTTINITNSGGGFNTSSAAPVITIAGGGTPTTSATVSRVLGSGGTVAATVTGNGTGYFAPPRVVIGAAPSGGTNATATAIINTATGQVVGIDMTNLGSGYTSVPSITLIGGGTVGQPAASFATSIIPAGNVSFTAATSQGSGTYGQFTVTAGSVNLQESTTLNIASITSSGSVTANSSAGDVLINGPITTYNNSGVSLRANRGSLTEAGTGLISAGTGTLTANVNGSSGNVTLTNAANVFGTLSYNASSSSTVANIVVSSSVNANTVAGGSGNFTLSTVSPGQNITITAGNYNGTATFNSAGSINLTSNNSTNSVTARNLVLIAGDTGASSITQNRAGASQIVNVNGTLTLSTAGGVTLNGTNNPSLGNIVLSNVTSTTNEIKLSTRGNITGISGTALGTVNLTSGTVGQNSIPSASSITLGNLNVGNLVASAQNGGYDGDGQNNPLNGASGDIKQASGSRLHVDNTLTAIAFNGGNVALTNNGNSAGRVQLSTGGTYPTAAGNFTTTNNTTSGGSISYTEDPTIRLGALQTAGNATLISRFGSIVDDSAGTVINVGGLLTLSAPNGSVLLTTGNTTGPIAAASANASGSVVLSTGTDITLGSINANSLTVTANSISQSAPLGIFGLSSFTASAGGINLTNDRNNFGPIAITVAAANQNVAVTEGTTLNLRSFSMPGGGNGTVTINSVNGDIIDTGLQGVVLGGTAATSGSGAVSLLAANGNITIDDPTSNINTSAGLGFTAKNVVISILGSAGSNITLGTASQNATATGNLTVTNIQGGINQAAPIRVGGTASFQAAPSAAGAINLTNVNNGFGLVQFSGNTVNLTESGNMDIATGSNAFGAARLISVQGHIGITSVGSGVVTFGSTVYLQAATDITLPKLVTATGQLTLSHTGTANLSALSITSDLNGITPLDLGSGPYVPPSQ